MTYATQSHLVDRFGSDELAQLTDRETGATIDAAVLGRALADADAEIDGYLAARYTLPLASTPVTLVRIAAYIARYRLFADRATDAVRQFYADAVRDLKAIAAGNIIIDGALPLAASTNTITVKVSAPEPIFNSDALGLY